MRGPAPAHVRRLRTALDRSVDQLDIALRWGSELATVLTSGNRLLVAGNGGSAAQAQHLTAELVGRYRAERRPFSAIALHADTSSVTAISNDYGADEVFARQVQAHGRPGDVCLLLSTSGRSTNLLAAARRARVCGLSVWAMTGCRPNPLASLAHQVLEVRTDDCAAVQEVHLVAVHMICEQLDADLADLEDLEDLEDDGLAQVVNQ
jgi:D-sedoheptulose 7-phosphate isomerase